MAGGRNYDRNHKAQVITKFLLLDRLATALGVDSGDRFVKPRVAFTETIHDRLQPILRSTVKWHIIGLRMREHLASMADNGAGLFSGPTPATLNQDEEAFCRNMGWLWGAHRSFLKSDLAIAEGNLQLMAFKLRWHATVGAVRYLLLA